jgi:hypothetical protein
MGEDIKLRVKVVTARDVVPFKVMVNRNEKIQYLRERVLSYYKAVNEDGDFFTYLLSEDNYLLVDAYLVSDFINENDLIFLLSKDYVKLHGYRFNGEVERNTAKRYCESPKSVKRSKFSEEETQDLKDEVEHGDGFSIKEAEYTHKDGNTEGGLSKGDEEVEKVIQENSTSKNTHDTFILLNDATQHIPEPESKNEEPKALPPSSPTNDGKEKAESRKGGPTKKKPTLPRGKAFTSKLEDIQYLRPVKQRKKKEEVLSLKDL